MKTVRKSKSTKNKAFFEKNKHVNFDVAVKAALKDYLLQKELDQDDLYEAARSLTYLRQLAVSLN